jgi:hypothetical protein
MATASTSGGIAPPQLDNSGMLAGAMRLQGYFLNFNWAYGTVRTAGPLDERSVLLFSGADRNDGAVSVTVEDVSYRLIGNDMVRLLLESSVPTTMILSHTDWGRAGDPRSISQGQF